MNGKTSNMEVFPCMGSLPMYGQIYGMGRSHGFQIQPGISMGTHGLFGSLSRGTVGICNYCFIVSKHGHELVVAPAKSRFETIHRQHCSS